MMKPQRKFILPILVLLCALAPAHAADSVYITNQIRVGMHEEKSTDSAIVKVLASGSRLELVKRDETASFVRAADGTTGWIDNSYLAAQAPAAGDELAAAQERESALQARIDELQKQLSLPGRDAPASQPELEQQLKSERIKVGELQVQLAQMRKRAGQNSDTDSLFEQIDKLEQRNKNLEVQLAAATRRESAGEIPASTSGTDQPGIYSWRVLAVSFGILFVIGLALGVYLMDWMNRRRHGGFRV